MADEQKQDPKPKLNKDGFVPGQRLTPQELAELKQRKRKQQ